MENNFQLQSPQTSARGCFFSRRIKKTSRAPLRFCNNSVKQVQFRKHLDFYLGGKLHFCEHLQNMFKEVNKAISLLRK